MKTNIFATVVIQPAANIVKLVSSKGESRTGFHRERRSRRVNFMAWHWKRLVLIFKILLRRLLRHIHRENILKASVYADDYFGSRIYSEYVAQRGSSSPFFGRKIDKI